MKILLYILILIVVFVLVLVLRTLLTKQKTTYYEYSKDEKRTEEYATKLSKMIQYETVSDADKPDSDKFRGFHKELAKLFPTLFKELEVIDIDGNLLLKWPGINRDLEPLMLISHMDVVEATGKWSHEPFSGDIDDTYVWGRGASDTKCSLMAFLEASEELLKEGYKPKCDVYLGSSCTEEIGGDGAPKIVNYLKEKSIKLYMLCDEGGSLVEDPINGVKGQFAAIGIFEKGYGDIKIIAKSSGGHSSTPSKGTAIPRLAKFISEIENHNPFKVKFSKAVDAFLKNVAPYCTNFGLKLVMVNEDILKPLLKIVIPKISAEAAAMLQTTIAFTMQKGSDGYNVLPQTAWVTANLRYIPHQKMEESNKLISDIAAKYGLETEVLKSNNPSKELDLNSEQFKMVTKTINTVFPGVGILPYVVTGGTDARFYGPICDHCVRFSPVMYGKEQLSAMHGLNENLRKATLPMAVDYYKAIIKAQEDR